MEANVIDAPPVSSAWAGRSRRLLSLWPWLPLPVGVAYLLLLLVKFNQIVATTYLNADAASAPVIGALYGGSPAHRQVFLGQMGWFSTLMFELATRWLPAHRQLWEAAPYAMAMASVALIAWAAWRVAGRWAAAITGTLLLCAGPQTIGLLFSLDDHSPTWFSLALLSALLVFFLAPPSWLKRWSGALVVLVAGAIVGANAASDLVLLVAGIAPLLIAAAVTWALRPGRASERAWWWLLALVVVAGVAYALTLAWVHHENVLIPGNQVHNQLAAAEALPTNFKLWWQSLMVLGNGDFFGQLLGFTTALQLICGFMSLVAVALVLRLAWRELAPFERVRDESSGAAAAQFEPRHGERPAAVPPLRIAWCAFWASSALLLTASFIFSSNPLDLGSARYLLGVIYAAAALLPLLAGPRVLSRALITAGATVFALTGLVALLDNQELVSGNPSAGLYGQVTHLIEREHLTVGYSDYWDAAPLIWSSHFAVHAYPVQDCGANELCWSYLHMITSWYTTPRPPGTRSFLISNTAQPVPATPTPNLGKPSATYQLGTITLYVYPYDIGTRTIP